jgi:hypothetical protein
LGNCYAIVLMGISDDYLCACLGDGAQFSRSGLVGPLALKAFSADRPFLGLQPQMPPLGLTVTAFEQVAARFVPADTSEQYRLLQEWLPRAGGNRTDTI